jgi:hypothetical protein
MELAPILVVGETPSLGRSIVDLLESGSLPCQFVLDLEEVGPLANLSERYPVVVAACNEAYCSTVRRWSRGEFPRVSFVVVGSRDPALRSVPGLRTIPLPLVPDRLLSVIRSLTDGSSATASRGPPSDSPAISPERPPAQTHT